MNALEYFAIAIVSLLSATGEEIQDPFHIVNQYNVFQPDLEPDFKYDLPKVFGVRSCGGHGKLLSLRIKGCEPDSRCRIPVSDDKPRPWELEFIPSIDTNGIGLKVNMLMDGVSKTVYDRAIDNSAVLAGKKFIIASAGVANKELKGKDVTFQAIIYRVNDNNSEVCLESDYTLY